LVEAILEVLKPRAGEDLLLFVNGFGGTPSMELYLMYHAAESVLIKHRLRASRSLVGNYVTSLEMAGCSIPVAKLDNEMLKLWDAPVHAPALRWGR
jgi:dihydroxyacetone kinase-like protein